MNKKENGLPRAIKALAMTNKGTFSYPTKIREEGKRKGCRLAAPLDSFRYHLKPLKLTADEPVA